MTITILVRENGPYRISVEDAPSVRIVDAAGRVLEPTADKPISLCRCGASATKPFCDGTHKTLRALNAPGTPHVKDATHVEETGPAGSQG